MLWDYIYLGLQLIYPGVTYYGGNDGGSSEEGGD